MFPCIKKIPLTVRAAAAAVAINALPAFAADTTPTRPVSKDPAALRPIEHIRGGPASPADLAEMARLDGLPPLTASAGNGDFLLKPPYAPAPEQTPRPDVPKGRVENFSVEMTGSKFYPDTGLRGYTPKRAVTVYIPSQYIPGTSAPLLVTHDAYGARNNQLATILDNMIADKRLPAMIAVMVANGGGDARGSERGYEYDSVTGKFAEFIEAEILPRVEKDYGVKISKDPEGRATMGGSSGGAVAFTMAWFHPEWYRRVLTYSGTFTNNQSVEDPKLPHGAWEYHEHLIPQNPAKPIRLWMEVGQNDNGSVNASADQHNWVIANQRMASAMKAKGYSYQFVFALGAGHTDRNVIAQTLPAALEWLWQGYKSTEK